jgi:hypothetical protein
MQDKYLNNERVLIKVLKCKNKYKLNLINNSMKKHCLQSNLSIKDFKT